MSKQQLNTAYSFGGLSCVVKTVSKLSGHEHPVRGEGHLGRRDRDHQRRRRRRRVPRHGHPGPVHRHRLARRQPQRSRASRRCSSCARATASATAATSGASPTSSSTCRASRASSSAKTCSSNPATLYKLATTAVDNITPQQSLTNPLTLVQIALAVKNVPFDEIVFVQYPVNDDPADPNKVVPNETRGRGAVGGARGEPAAASSPARPTRRRCRRGRADDPRHARPGRDADARRDARSDRDGRSSCRRRSPARPRRRRPAPTATSRADG